MSSRAKTLIGEVIGKKMQKTAVVRVRRTVQDPLYKKVIRRKSKLKAHDEKDACREGDRVRIVECRPLSKEKSWRVIEILSRAKELEHATSGGEE